MQIQLFEKSRQTLKFSKVMLQVLTTVLIWLFTRVNWNVIISNISYTNDRQNNYSTL